MKHVESHSLRGAPRTIIYENGARHFGSSCKTPAFRAWGCLIYLPIGFPIQNPGKIGTLRNARNARFYWCRVRGLNSRPTVYKFFAPSYKSLRRQHFLPEDNPVSLSFHWTFLHLLLSINNTAEQCITPPRRYPHVTQRRNFRMAKTLTAVAVKAFRPTKTRREIPDGGCAGIAAG